MLGYPVTPFVFILPKSNDIGNEWAIRLIKEKNIWHYENEKCLLCLPDPIESMISIAAFVASGSDPWDCDIQHINYKGDLFGIFSILYKAEYQSLWRLIYKSPRHEDDKSYPNQGRNAFLALHWIKGLWSIKQLNSIEDPLLSGETAEERIKSAKYYLDLSPSKESKLLSLILKKQNREALNLIYNQFSFDERKKFAKEIFYISVIALEGSPIPENVLHLSSQKDILVENIPDNFTKYIASALSELKVNGEINLERWTRKRIPKVHEIQNKKNDPYCLYDLGGFDGVLYSQLYFYYSDIYFHTRDNNDSQQGNQSKKNKQARKSILPDMISKVIRHAVNQLRIDMGLPQIGEGWVNETLLLNTAKKYFDEVVHQYSPDWLGRQRIDVYIPSIKTAIEYNGLQHYEAIGIFGGKNGLTSTKRRDTIKSKKCRENGVNLLIWKYDRAVSDENFLSFMNEHNIKIK